MPEPTVDLAADLDEIEREATFLAVRTVQAVAAIRLRLTLIEELVAISNDDVQARKS